MSATGFSSTSFGSPVAKHNLAVFGIPSIPLLADPVALVVSTGVVDGYLSFADTFDSGSMAGRAITGQTATWYEQQILILAGAACCANRGTSAAPGHFGASELVDLGVKTEFSVVIEKDPIQYQNFANDLGGSQRTLIGLWQQVGASYTEVDALLNTPSSGAHTVQLNIYNDGVLDEYSADVTIPTLFTTQTSHKATLVWGAATSEIYIDDVLVLTMDNTPFIGTKTFEPTDVYVGFDGTQASSVEVWNRDELPGGFVEYPVTQFGTPAGQQVFPQGEMLPSTAFGTPNTPVKQTCEAEGFTGTDFGDWTIGIKSLGARNYRVAVAPSRTIQFGTPEVQTTVTVEAHGQQDTAFGTPKSAMRLAVSGSVGTALGHPAAVLVAKAKGFSTASFGKPVCAKGYAAAHTYRPARFGTPKVQRSDCYPTRGVNLRAKFGRPTGKQGAIKPATGFTQTAFGVPGSSFTYRVMHLSPQSRFGQPLVKRMPQC